MTKNQISKLIKLLNNKKAVQSIDILSNIMKEFCDFFSEFIYKGISHCVIEGNFIADIKEAEVCPPYKNDGRIDKSNCLAISILYNVSKIYERCLFSQLYHCFDKIFLKKISLWFS